MRRIIYFLLFAPPLFAHFEEYEPQFEEVGSEFLDYDLVYAYPHIQDSSRHIYYKTEEMLQRAFDKKLEPYFRKYVKPSSTVIEVGAQIGVQTLLLSDLVGPHGKVFAIESDADLFEFLHLNVRHNLASNVTISRGSNMFSLDALGLKNVSLIRIFVSGRENLCLEGAYQIIQKCKPVILITLLGGIPANYVDKYQHKELERRIDKLKQIGYSSSYITPREYLVLPMH